MKHESGSFFAAATLFCLYWTALLKPNLPRPQFNLAKITVKM